MPGLADNFVFSTYVSDDGNTYSSRTPSTWAASAVSGGTATSAFRNYGRESRRRAKRKFVFRTSTAIGRSITLPVFTSTAYNAGVLGTTTFARAVKGVALAVTFTLARKIGEKVPGSTVTTQGAQQYP